MIAREVAPHDAAAVARAAGQRAQAAWLASPGPGELTVEREWVACDPVEVVRGDGVEAVRALERAWERARTRWAGAPAGVPIGIGHLSYDLGASFERFRDRERPGAGFPDVDVRFYDALWTRDAASGRTMVLAATDAAGAALERALAVAADAEVAVSCGPLEPVDDPAAFVAAVRRVGEYLRAGDAYQVNLARRLAAHLPPVSGEPVGWALAAQLRRTAAAPHALWLADDGRALVGNSPERLLRLGADGLVETCPIKGTRPRGRTALEDARLAAELLGAPKDRAEHAMIVDLERNDLGRVCTTGTVEVAGWGRLLPLPTVFHMVSTVRGRLAPGVGLERLLRATFPGGSITGAPKLRAMEIIAELEHARRGPYTGATGWFGAAGDLDLAVAIRTALVDGDRLVLWVGGGIVVDSDPEAELAETRAKAEAFARLTSPLPSR